MYVYVALLYRDYKQIGFYLDDSNSSISFYRMGDELTRYGPLRKKVTNLIQICPQINLNRPTSLQFLLYLLPQLLPLPPADYFLPLHWPKVA